MPLSFFWALSITCVKLSILLFYRRLFQQKITTTRWCICRSTLCAACAVFDIVSFFGGAFQCTPVAYLWDKSISGGTCVDFIAFARFTSIFNIVTDVLILAVSVPIVRQLQMERSKKIDVLGLFLLGGW